MYIGVILQYTSCLMAADFEQVTVIVGVHLSNDLVSYEFMMFTDLGNSFLLRLRIKSF